MRDRWKQIKNRERNVIIERKRGKRMKREGIEHASNKVHKVKGYDLRVRESLVGKLQITPRLTGRHGWIFGGNDRAGGTGVDLLPSLSFLFSSDLGNYSFPLEETKLHTNLIFGYTRI